MATGQPQAVIDLFALGKAKKFINFLIDFNAAKITYIMYEGGGVGGVGRCWRLRSFLVISALRLFLIKISIIL